MDKAGSAESGLGDCPPTAEALKQLRESLVRARAHPDFISEFYRRFFLQHPESFKYFRKTDLDRQREKLDYSLGIILQFLDDAPGIDFYLNYLGHMHQRLQIPEQLFHYWNDALLETLAECDPEFHTCLADKWRHALEYSVGILIKAMADVTNKTPT